MNPRLTKMAIAGTLGGSAALLLLMPAARLAGGYALQAAIEAPPDR